MKQLLFDTIREDAKTGNTGKVVLRQYRASSQILNVVECTSRAARQLNPTKT
jgi:hypothetical protein